MKYNDAIEAAIKYVATGVETDIPIAQNEKPEGRGRPPHRRIVNGITLARDEYDVYLALRSFWESAKKITMNQSVLTDEEFVAFMKTAAPLLNKRMIDMALVSDDLKAVRQVAADLADRGYGKAAQQININVSQSDVRTAWQKLQNRSDIDVSNLIECEAVVVYEDEDDA